MEGVTFPPRNETKWPIYCSIQDCRSNSNENLNLSFHRFPRPKVGTVKIANYFGNLEKVDLLTAWKKATQIKIVKTKSSVCSRHFTKQDYFFPDMIMVTASQKILKKTSIPSINLPSRITSKVKMDCEKLRVERLERRELRCEIKTEPIELNVEEPIKNHDETIKKEIDFAEIGKVESNIESFLDIDGNRYSDHSDCILGL